MASFPSPVSSSSLRDGNITSQFSSQIVPATPSTSVLNAFANLKITEAPPVPDLIISPPFSQGSKGEVDSNNSHPRSFFHRPKSKGISKARLTKGVQAPGKPKLDPQTISRILSEMNRDSGQRNNATPVVFIRQHSTLDFRTTTNTNGLVLRNPPNFTNQNRFLVRPSAAAFETIPVTTNQATTSSHSESFQEDI